MSPRLGARQRQIMTVLAGADQPMTVVDVNEHVWDVDDTQIREALRLLYGHGLVVRTGAGVHGDPYRFALPPAEAAS